MAGPLVVGGSGHNQFGMHRAKARRTRRCTSQCLAVCSCRRRVWAVVSTIWMVEAGMRRCVGMGASSQKEPLHRESQKNLPKSGGEVGGRAKSELPRPCTPNLPCPSLPRRLSKTDGPAQSDGDAENNCNTPHRWRYGRNAAFSCGGTGDHTPSKG